MLLWVGIAGISMFFAGLTSAYIVRKAEGNWTEFEMPDWFLLSTIGIVLSSAFLIFAKRLVKQNKNGTLCLFVALLLGVVFSFSQFKDIVCPRTRFHCQFVPWCTLGASLVHPWCILGASLVPACTH